MTDVAIRPLASLSEREACVALQEVVWGRPFPDRVPASLLMIAQETGGVASGAFMDGDLVGFVFGVTGYRAGGPFHWSDMLAVAPEHRGRGIGYRLKLHQREQLLENGVERVRWTFDPLEAGNAHFGLRRLGATAGEYRQDLYGASSSPLHEGIGTDRLVADWAIASDRVAERLEAGALPGPRHDDEPPVLNPVPDGSSRPGPVGEPASEAVRIVVPADIQALKRADLPLAVEWRRNVRLAFERAFAAGFVAVDLEWGVPLSRYILTLGLDR